jgi:N-acetylneuraminic acid mutarotase
MPFPIAAGGAVRVGDRIFLVGGVRTNDAGEDVLSDHTLVYDISAERWRVRPPVTTLRQHLGAAAFGGKVYVIGGRTHGLDTNLGVVERLNPTTGRWRKLPDLPTARGGLAATATGNGYVVAVGGESPSGTNPEAEAFEVSSGRWLSLAPLPTPRHGLAVVALGNVVYVIGGGPEPGLTYSDANEAIDLTGT